LRRAKRAFPQPIRGVTDVGRLRARDDVAMNTNENVVALADRRSHDLEVVLRWARRSGRLWVDVTGREGERLARIDATPANALDVFNHPFAYAREAA
jgi:hypothetical protein